MAITILLVDDHPLFRKGLCLLLEGQEDFCIVGEAGDGQEAIDRVRTLSPDVVIMDITMPDFNGIDATRKIVSEVPSAKVVALSMHAGKRFVEDMLQAGAAGYILKKSVPEDLVNGIRIVTEGDIYLSPAITGIVVSKYKELLEKSPSAAYMKDTSPILRTKLHRIPLPEGYVHRPRLLERLEQHRQRPLTLVSAPAGYGKSTLVSSWLQGCASPHAWLSLDNNDNDLHLFLSYFLAAVETMFPDAASETMTLVDTPTLPPLSVLTGSLANELDLIEQDFILVLDDIHHIREESVYNLLAELLRHPPQSMHLVLIGRRDPSLPIASLRAREQVTEVRLFDLRFTAVETAEFLQIALGGKFSEARAATLTKKTEGWVTGLRLACLSMLHRNDLDPKLIEPGVDAQSVMEYLFTEVFSLQPPEISQYLIGTAILDRFCGPLCEAVCASGVDSSRSELGGRDFIAWLKKENVFLIPLDTENRWFRYHHLFQKLLVNQLKRHCSTEEINVLHSRASGWFAEEGLIEEALEHTLAAGDVPTAIQMVAGHGHQLMDDQRWARLERWLDMLPRDSVEDNPEMFLFRLWSNHMRTAGFDVSALATQLEKIENLISTSPPNDSVKVEQIRSHCNALRSFQHYVGAQGEIALKHARLACENIPIHHKRSRLRAHIFQVGSYQMLGDLETGLSLYYKEVKENPNLSAGDQAMYLANLCFIYWIDADLISMLQTSENTLKIATDHRRSEAIAFSLYFNGIACYHQNDLQRAEEKLARLVKDFYMYMQLVHTHGSFCLSLIYQAQGQPDKARERNRKMMEYASDTDNQMLLRTTQAFEAELALRQGRLSEASNWAERFHPKPFLPPFAFYTPQLTLVKILLAQDTTDSRGQAADLLDQLHDFLASIHYKKSLIEVLALQGLLHDTLGDASVAQEKLAKALALAEPGGFVRLFVDLGPQMADLLKCLHEQNVAVDYIEKVRAAFRDDEQVVVVEAADHPVVSAHQPLRPSTPSQPLFVPLTNRELDILELLAQRLSNQEIAEKLFISTTTVKGHLQSIYGKLEVNKRREAVEKAHVLGIFPRR